jgi:Peptidase family M48
MERIPMIRHAIIAISACLYLAISVWLVSKQGQAYREELRRDKLAAARDEKPAAPQPELKNEAPAAAAPETVASQSETPPAAAAVSPRPAPQPGRDQAQTSAVAARESSQPKRTDAPIADRVSERPPEKTAAPVTTRAAENPSGKAAASADPLAANPFWTQPEMMRNWDVGNLSAADEQKLGVLLHDVIVQLNPVAADGPWQQRLEDAAKPFLATLQHKEIRYHFEVMESNEVNAFSHPGGYVYVSRGLFDLIGEDEDYALQFAVGNEIAHVDLRHAIKCLQDPDFKNMTGGTIRKLYWLVIPLGYLVTDTVNQDFEADEWTFSRMRSFGRSKRETLAFLYKLDGYAKRNGFGAGRGKVRLGADSASFLDIHYRRQTAAWRRLENLKERIK